MAKSRTKNNIYVFCLIFFKICIFKSLQSTFFHVTLFCQNFLSLFFLFPNTFIYESILIKLYLNAIIMNTQILFIISISLTSKVIEGHKIIKKPNSLLKESLVSKSARLLLLFLLLSQKVLLLLHLMQIYGRFCHC